MSAAQLVARAKALASLPASFQHVTETIDRPGASADDIAEAMRADPGLAGRLLKVSNSAFFGYPRRVDNLRQAVVIIGTRQILDLMTATVAIQRFEGIAPELVDMRSFWRHSLACGLAARSLAQLRGEPNPERFFISGLLHDVGSLVLYQTEGERAATALRRHRETRAPLDVVERDIFGFDHADVGAELLAAWRLPPAIRASAGEHHRVAPASNYGMTTAVVHVADVLVHALDLGTNGESFVPRLAPAAWSALGAPLALLESVAERLHAGLEELEDAFLRRP